MTKFEDFEYQRPDEDRVKADFEHQLTAFEQANTLREANAAIEAINAIRTDFSSMYNICHIRHTLDTTDQFYEQENRFFDRANPAFTALTTRYYHQLLQSPFRDALKERWGDQLFVIAELSTKTFIPEILEDLQRENELSSAYTKLKATAKIELDGEVYNLASIHKLELSRDREVRRRAWRAKWNWFERQRPEIDRIFDELVKTRHRIAQQLGYTNFVELGYVRMLRSDYDAAMVEHFRHQVKQHVVPMATELFDRQRRRLQLDQLYHYDEDYKFPSGNAEPQGESRWIIERAHEMYTELSPETRTFFDRMLQQNLMDLVTREGKATGGYCTFIGKYQAPFIFSNFNGTSGDINVLTHEAGHAFQVYESRNIGINEYHWPTYEACEIHSMSMEFFTFPWMEKFFGEEVEKFKFGHVADAVCFLPYGVAVDEFQHRIYENPECTPDERRAIWKSIEANYLPHRNYDGQELLEAGGFWMRQSHIFSAPFYYVDYALAQICAFQFWKKDRSEHTAAWSDYLRLCQAGGSGSFLELVRLANLRSPFQPGAVSEAVGEVRQYLDAIDDTAF